MITIESRQNSALRHLARLGRERKYRRSTAEMLCEGEKMLEEAAPMRMAVLETQTCNERAIAFYRNCGFEIIGFDLYAYSNHDPEAHEVRLEMGKKLT